ncbi:MAG: hypothetical protein ABFQ65_01530 [Nanoarchaeota archaeon]
MIPKQLIKKTLSKKKFNPINGDPDNWGESIVSSDGNTLSTRIPSILLKYFKAGDLLHWEKDDLLEGRFIINNQGSEKKSKPIYYTKDMEEEKKLISDHCRRIAKKIECAKRFDIQKNYIIDDLNPHTNSNTLKEIQTSIKRGTSNYDEIIKYLNNEIAKHKTKEKQIKDRNEKHKKLHDQAVQISRRKDIESEKRDFDILEKAIPKTNKQAIEVLNWLKKRLGIKLI